MKKLFLIIPLLGLLFILSGCKSELASPENIIGARQISKFNLYEDDKIIANYDVLQYSQEDIVEAAKKIKYKKATKNDKKSDRYLEVESYPHAVRIYHYDYIKIYDTGLIYIYAKSQFGAANSKNYKIDTDIANEIIDIAYNRYNDYLAFEESCKESAIEEGKIGNLITNLNTEYDNTIYRNYSSFSKEAEIIIKTTEFELIDYYDNNDNYIDYYKTHSDVHVGEYDLYINKIENIDKDTYKLSSKKWYLEIDDDYTTIWLTYTYTAEKYNYELTYFYEYRISAEAGEQLYSLLDNIRVSLD